MPPSPGTDGAPVHRRPSPAVLRRTLLELGALVLTTATVAWLCVGRLCGFSAERAPSLVFVSSTPRLWVALVVAAIAVLVGLLGRDARTELAQALRARLGRTPRPSATESSPPVWGVRLARLRSCVRPLWLLTSLLVPYLRLVVDQAPLAGPLCHLTHDLAPWIVLTAVGWSAARWFEVSSVSAVGEWLDRRITTLPANTPRIRLTWIVFALALTAVAAGSPTTRFRGVVGGDEPKYLRFCEALLQTNGFAVGNLVPYGDFTARDVSWSGFPRTFAATLAEEVPAMLHDAGLMLRGEAPASFNRAGHATGWFITGKNGGLYQVHLPGLSLLLLAPYAIDRLWISSFDGYTQGFPTWLVFTSLTMAVVFALWIVALYRFLRDATHMPRLSAGVALVTGLTIPLFPFHALFYPEALAGLVILTLVRHLELGPPARLARALWMGCLAGYLPWLHNRFALPSVFLVGWFVVRHPRDLGALVAFLSPYLAALGLQALYYYRITGSILPTAIWQVLPGHGPVELGGIPRALVGYLVDRTYGILPLAPIYLLAPAGVWLAWKVNRGRVARLMALGAILVFQAAGHFDWWGGGSAPARLIVAAVPFAAMGFAELVRVARAQSWLWVVCGVLLVISVHNAVVYTRDYSRLDVQIHTPTPFAYRTPLSFPYVAFPPGGLDQTRTGLVGYWLAVLAAANAVALLAIRRGERRGVSEREGAPATGAAQPWRPTLVTPIAVLAGAAALYTVPAALGGELCSATLLPSVTEIRALLLDALSRHPVGWVVRSGGGTVDPAMLKRTWLAVTYRFDPPDAIEPLKGGVVSDTAPASDSRVPGEPRPALQVPARVPPRTRVARIELGLVVGGPHQLEVHLRLGEPGANVEAPQDPVLEVGVVDEVAHRELARVVVTAGELARDRYRAIPLALDLPQGAAAVVRITKLGHGELWIEKAVLRHE